MDINKDYSNNFRIIKHIRESSFIQLQLRKAIKKSSSMQKFTMQETQCDKL